MTPALRWAAMRAILMFHKLAGTESQDSVQRPQLLKRKESRSGFEPKPLRLNEKLSLKYGVLLPTASKPVPAHPLQDSFTPSPPPSTLTQYVFFWHTLKSQTGTESDFHR